MYKKIEGLTKELLCRNLVEDREVLIYLTVDLYDEYEIIIELADQIDFNLFFMLQPRIHDKIKERFLNEVNSDLKTCFNEFKVNYLDITMTHDIEYVMNNYGKQKFKAEIVAHNKTVSIYNIFSKIQDLHVCTINVEYDFDDMYNNVDESLILRFGIYN